MNIQSTRLTNNKVGAVLVAGAGIGGIQAALDLANTGFKVYLVDSAPAIGGIMAQLDKTFPTNDCSMCIMAPKLVECGRHLNIEIFSNSRIESVKGKAGDYLVRVTKKARFVDMDKCKGCGECRKHCPVEIPDRFNQGFISRKSVYIDYPQAVPAKYLIDKVNCLGCGVCEKVCLAGAIKYKDTDEAKEINVGALILSPGSVTFDPKVYTKFGYGQYKNVVTSIEFERILSASGPFHGHLLRPYEGKVPKRVAFIQCVGSRDPQIGRSYCSSVCCTYAIKEAIIAKEHSKGGLETTIFFMDIRTFGKGFEAYYERAKKEYGVRFIRAGVSKITEDPQTRNLLLQYESEDGELKQEEFDMVVLSVGLTPKEGMDQLARKMMVSLDEHGFCKTSEFLPVDTIQDGIYVCGAFSGPKDIPETVTQASAAAAKAMGLLAGSRNSLVAHKVLPPETNILDQVPRVGVFVCHCGINIGGYVDVPKVVEYVKKLPNVVYAENNLYTCSQDTQKRIVDMIKEHNLNRVVVASCTPRTHEPLFRETIREAGLNTYLFEMANIRDQCSWIHMNELKDATEKAIDLVRMAVCKASLLAPLKQVEIDVIQKALVIGGGIAGMVSSLSLAEQGFEVFLVEKEKELGGNLSHIYRTLDGRNAQEFLKKTVQKVKGSKLIKLFTGARIELISGFIGNYETEISVGGGAKEKVKHGVVIVATGAHEYQPTEYLYGKDSRVVTQKELEERLFRAAGSEERGARSNPATTLGSGKQDENPPSGLSPLTSVVMIQCVGSREDRHPYCSRICCMQAVKNALRVRADYPNSSVYVLYRDVRTYGLKEDFYQKAREAGVVFIRYDENSMPKVAKQNGTLKVSLIDPIINEEITIASDLLVLSSGVEPHKENQDLAKMLKVPLNSEGFYLEAHVKLRPVDFATEGVFVAGMAHCPKSIDEAIGQAEAAAARASTIISKNKYYAEATVSSVNEDLCAGCGVCSALCPYEAIAIQEKDGKRVSRVNEALCKGCGTCVAACTSGAMVQYGFTKRQIMAMVETFTEA